jgi:osmotically-inducible protein OsmY
MTDDAAHTQAVGRVRAAPLDRAFIGETMTHFMKQTISRSFLALLLGALVMSLAACGERQSAENVGRSIDQTVERGGEKMNQAAETAGEKLAAAGQRMDDAALEARVKAALIAAPGLKSLAIDVEAANGVVTLAGTADNPDKRDLAEQLASNIDGVTSVRNRIVVTGS